MGIIMNAMGSALGSGLSMAGAQYDQNQAAEERMANSAALTREKLDLMRETTNMKLEARVAEVAAKYAAKEGGGSGNAALFGMLNDEIRAAGGVGAATGTSFKPTDRAAFERDVPLLVPNDDEGNPMPPTGLKELDQKGYAAAEDERTRKVQETILLLSKDPSHLKGFREGQGQELVNLVTEYAIKNPKASVAELADRVALQKPGTERIDVEGGTAFNKFGVGENEGIIATQLGGSKTAEDPATKSQRLMLNVLLNASTQEDKSLGKRLKDARDAYGDTTKPEKRAQLDAEIAEIKGAMVRNTKSKVDVESQIRELGAGLAAPAPAGKGPLPGTARGVADALAAWRAVQR